MVDSVIFTGQNTRGISSTMAYFGPLDNATRTQIQNVPASCVILLNQPHSLLEGAALVP